jgi:hypothetical protein
MCSKKRILFKYGYALCYPFVLFYIDLRRIATSTIAMQHDSGISGGNDYSLPRECRGIARTFDLLLFTRLRFLVHCTALHIPHRHSRIFVMPTEHAGDNTSRLCTEESMDNSSLFCKKLSFREASSVGRRIN